jgi:hypothetical protein
MICFLLLMMLVAGEGDQKSDNRGWPCDRKIDPSYITVAEGSGGQVQLFQPSEASGSLALMEAHLKGNEETIFRASGTLSGEKEFTFSVDPSVESVTFSAFIQCMKSIDMFSPSGEILAAAPNSKQYNFISGRIITIATPERGEWKIHISGSGYFSVVAEAKTSITFDARFVQLGGRPAHEGYFPIERLPKRNQPETLSIEFEGPVRSAHVKLINRDGELLQNLQLEKIQNDQDSFDLLGSLTIASETFRIVIEGEDQNGFHFQRYDPRLLSTQP